MSLLKTCSGPDLGRLVGDVTVLTSAGICDERVLIDRQFPHRDFLQHFHATGITSGIIPEILTTMELIHD
jgi:hypothetical protein